MRVSFIVTTYNVLPYLEKCLGSIAACTKFGDRVLIVDDGSTDGTDLQINSIIETSNFAKGVQIDPINLGVNTFGGVGIPGNIGLKEALSDPECEAIFFVDGDDWILPKGFLESRSYFEENQPDILINNYVEYNQLKNEFRGPSDRALWGDASSIASDNLNTLQKLALRMIAVPWRKFYRAEFLREHQLKYPEGDFFFEDNVFHWEVCLKANRISFLNREICAHRYNRPGQTMASTGKELAAFFTHYDAILDIARANSADHRNDLEAEALGWLLTNMNWHIERLKANACWDYANRAAKAMRNCPQDIWQLVSEELGNLAVYPLANSLRDGDISGVALHLAQLASLTDISGRLSRVEDDLAHQMNSLERTERIAAAQREIMKFQALSDTTFLEKKRPSGKRRASFFK